MPSLRTAKFRFFVFLCVLVLPASGCQHHQVHSGKSEWHAGPSSGITPAGPSFTWSPTGSHENAGDLSWLAAINALRKARGLHSLVWHNGLGAVASAHSKDMAQSNYLNLVAPQGYDVFQSLVTANPPMSFDNADAFVSQDPLPGNAATWLPTYMSYPAIAAILMDPTMTQIGLSGVSGPPGQNTFDFHTFILGQNVTP